MFLESSANYDVIKHTKGIDNSMLEFENFQKHSTPLTAKKIKRYTIALEVIWVLKKINIQLFDKQYQKI